jgi:hypothetical protein
MVATFRPRFTAVSTCTLGLGLALFTLSAACAPRHEHVIYVVEAAPPPEQVEVAPLPPTGNHVWIAGHWHWTGAEYAWIPGHWIARPHAHASWLPGHWRRVPRGWVWIEGHWS